MHQHNDNGLESLLHFEFHHALYPVNAYGNPQSQTLSNPAILSTGNYYQGSVAAFGENIPSQLTYRKFWTNTSLDPDGVDSYVSTFNSTVSLNSPYNNNKAFTMLYIPSTTDNIFSGTWVAQGAFRKGANIIVRGTYQIY